jgi:hypothetical protein
MNVFCFADRELAEKFRERFGGELLDPKDRPKWPGKAIASCVPTTATLARDTVPSLPPPNLHSPVRRRCVLDWARLRLRHLLRWWTGDS